MLTISPSRSRLPSPLRLLLCASVLVAAAFATNSALAENEPVEEGMPCFKEVCVGDDIRDLRAIPWEPAMVKGQPVAKASVSDDYFADLLKVVRGDMQALRRLAPFWFTKQLDAEGMRALDGVVAVCSPPGVADRLRAQYLSPNGYRTQVSFEPVPSADGLIQSFSVATITRTFSEALGPDRIAQIGAEIAKRYDGFSMYPRADKPGVRWLPHAQEGATLKLFAPIGDVRQRNTTLAKHPACE